VIQKCWSFLTITLTSLIIYVPSTLFSELGTSTRHETMELFSLSFRFSPGNALGPDRWPLLQKTSTQQVWTKVDALEYENLTAQME
jgi:hypothetical protein